MWGVGEKESVSFRFSQNKSLCEGVQGKLTKPPELTVQRRAVQVDEHDGHCPLST